jgi:hypothetical protein
MNKVLLCNIIIICICLIAITPNIKAMDIPPTNAFSKIISDNGTVHSMNYSYPLKILGGSGVSVKSNNSTYTVTISTTGGSGAGSGSYNETSANNTIINSNGFNINFINGTGNPVNVVNSNGGNQVNVTISSSGSGSGTTLDTMQNIGKGTGNSSGVYVKNTTNTNFQFYNITSIRPDLIMIKHNATDINLNSTFKANTITCAVNNFVSAYNNATGISICGLPTATGVTSLNFTTASDFDFNFHGNGSTITLAGTVFQFGLKPDVVLTNGSAQTITKSLTLNALTLGGAVTGNNQNITGTNYINSTKLFQGTNRVVDTISGTSPITTSKSGGSYTVACSTCITTAVTSATGTTGNVTVSASTGAVTFNTGYNIPLLSGIQTFTGNTTEKFGAGGIIIRNPASTFTTKLAGGAVTSNITETLPITSGTLLNAAITSINSDTTAAQNIVSGNDSRITVTNQTGRVLINTGSDIPLISKNNVFTGLDNFSNTIWIPSSTSNGLNILTATGTASTSPAIHLERTEGTITAPTATASGDQLGKIIWNGYDGSAITSGTNAIIAFADEAFTSTATGSSLRFFTTPIGSITETEKLRIPDYGGLRFITSFTDTSATNSDLFKSSTTTDTFKYKSSSKLYSISPQLRYNFTSAGNVTGTSSASLVMGGKYVTFTPLYSTNATITATGYIYDSVLADGCKFDIRQSTTNMGVAGTAVAGTKIGSNVQTTSGVAQENMTLSKTVVTTTLTPGTKYFFDISYARVTGGYCKILNLDWYVSER